MSTLAPAPGAPRFQSPKRRVSPARTGTPDPRPVTDYTATYSEVSGHSRLTVTLSQPCVIRAPLWPAIDCTAGTLVNPTSVTVVSNTVFLLDFAGALGGMVAFLQVPAQDMAVQNFLGGFVRGGGQWFRKPTEA